ncbi:hypothetical protein AB3N62_07365 [Leptospira sp. WS4.C2]
MKLSFRAGISLPLYLVCVESSYPVLKELSEIFIFMILSYLLILLY